MRLKLGFAACALALAVLWPGQRVPGAAVFGTQNPAQSQCCTLAQKEACMVAREIPECFDGVCRCVPRG